MRMEEGEEKAPGRKRSTKILSGFPEISMRCECLENETARRHPSGWVVAADIKSGTDFRVSSQEKSTIISAAFYCQ